MNPRSVKALAPAKELLPVVFTPKRPLKVALVEADATTQKSWAKLIGSFPNFSCVCACSTGEEALRMIPPLQPDVVLMDIYLPRMSGIQCTGRLKVSLPETRIVIFTALSNQELAMMALTAGADGYLLKSTKPSDLRFALLDVMHGGAPMTSEIARCVIESFRKKNAVRDDLADLSGREEQVLYLLSEGYSNKRIAEKLELGIQTVCSHVKHILTKLRVSSRTEAAIFYLNRKRSKNFAEKVLPPQKVNFSPA